MQIPPKLILKETPYLPGSTLLGRVRGSNPLWSSLLALGDNRMSCVLTYGTLAIQQVKCCLVVVPGVQKSDSPLACVLPSSDTTLGVILRQCPCAHGLCLLNKGSSELSVTVLEVTYTTNGKRVLRVPPCSNRKASLPLIHKGLAESPLQYLCSKSFLT